MMPIHTFSRHSLLNAHFNHSHITHTNTHTLTPPAYNCLACTSLLISLYVVSIAGLSVSCKLLHSLNACAQFVWSWPSFAARMYLKKRRMSGLSVVGFFSSFSSLRNAIKHVLRVCFHPKPCSGTHLLSWADTRLLYGAYLAGLEYIKQTSFSRHRSLPTARPICWNTASRRDSSGL